MASLDIRDFSLEATQKKLWLKLQEYGPGEILQFIGNSDENRNFLRDFTGKNHIQVQEVPIDVEWILAFVIPQNAEELARSINPGSKPS